jgi:hypothetical protein
MLAVLHRFPQEFEPLVMRCSGIYHSAHLLDADTRCEEAPSPRLTCVTNLRPSCRYAALWPLGAYVEKITMAFTPHLFESLKPPLLPRTTHELELFRGRLKKSRRPITGRKNTQDFILRAGSCVAMRLGLPPTHPWPDAFPHVHLNAFRHTLKLLRQTAKRRKCGHARHD